MKVMYKGTQLDLQAGDVVMFRNNLVLNEPVTYLSAAVRGFTRFPFNHCALIVANQGRPFISEAVAPGVVSRPAEKHLTRTSTQILVMRPHVSQDAWIFSMRANSALGTKYDYLDLLVHQPILRMTGRWVGPTQEPAAGRMVCSEFVAWAHQLPNWWMFSTREVYESGKFFTLFNEMAVLN